MGTADSWNCGTRNHGRRRKQRPPRTSIWMIAQSGFSRAADAAPAHSRRHPPKVRARHPRPGLGPAAPQARVPPVGRARREPGWESAPPASRPRSRRSPPRRRPAGPAACTWSSSLMSMKAGTLMVKARLRETLRSRTTPTGKGSGAARRYAQPLPGQPARAGLVGGAHSATSSPWTSGPALRLTPARAPP